MAGKVPSERIKLELVTPTRVVAEAYASEVQVPGFLGQFGVLPAHTVLLSLVKPGALRFVQDEVVHVYAIGKGLAEVGPDKLIILTDEAEEAINLNAKDLEASLARDMEVAKTLPASDPQLAVVQDRIERTQARLAVAPRKA